ncbi:sigma-70 family RNA polymerase sigma factor [Paenibacillus sp. OAS669]|uniref:sigma-70 family RNA polymerase sigma factor n=1 Tax=Paenibacillus sp. OAS669 TaxID=2663821 RepID=UPI00178A4152|nr:sigma-70 family RNA polymerase sigma factor [Paenibacillus sp. OAS669]MBE1446755.1 RNA polymerase sigma-70 factor (ECF subfamily) [Paenibacillus sp. OAS669]
MKIRETDLAAELRKRNEKALYRLIDLYGGLIRSIIRTHIPNPDALDECMDDVLLSIWNHIDTYDEEKNSFKNWVVAVTKYKSIDYRRSYARFHKKYPMEETDLDRLVDSAEPSKDEISCEMEQLLGHLKAHDRELLVKHYVKEYSIDEIAVDMGVQRSWIYNRLSRARQKLREIMKKRNGIDV